VINRPYDGISIQNFADWVEAGWTRKVFNEQDATRELAVMALGLPGEVGETIELIKKELRGDGPLDKAKLTLELGDVLHYLCRIAQHYDISLNEIMVGNIEKIEARRGKRAWEQNAVHSAA